MKKTDFTEIKKLDPKSLRLKINEANMELIDLKISLNMGKLANYKSIKNKKRDVAQMMTVLNQKLLMEELENKDGK